MATHRTYSCDINGCSDEVTHRLETLQVIFTTEQDEGRATAPYLGKESLDLCDHHFDRVLQGDAIWAAGAMGHNIYTFKT